MRRIGTAVLATMLLGGCSSPQVDGANAPDTAGLDRQQNIVNARPDLELVQQQMIDLDQRIRAVIGTDAPETVLDPWTTKASHGCPDPYTHNIGDVYSAQTSFGRPAPTDDQWRQITAELGPVFTAAGFRLNQPATSSPAAGDDSQTRDDGAFITLVDRPQGNDQLEMSYTTGCHLPAAWRATPPPPDLKPGNDAAIRYPYLYGPPGGRTAAPG